MRGAFHIFAPLLCGVSFVACVQVQTDSKSASVIGARNCTSELMPLTQRAGEQSIMTMSYDCGGLLCRGNEAFGAGLSFDVRFVLPIDLTVDFSLESDDESVVRATLVKVETDECAGETRVFASLSAGSEGSARITLVRDGEPIDQVAIRVEQAEKLELRASTTEAFDFSNEGGSIATCAGSSVLVMPRLLDAQGHALLGLPRLRWASADPDIAVVREQALNEPENLVKLATAESAVFIDATGPGTTAIEASTDYGVRASIEVVVEDGPSANRGSRAASVLGESEDALGDDVLLDIWRAAADDGLRPHE